MRAVTLDHATRDLEAVVTQVVDYAEPAILVNAAGKQVVILPLDDYNAWQETRYVLSSPANAASLRQSIAEDLDGQATERTLLGT